MPPMDMPPMRRSGVAICDSSFRAWLGEPIAASRRGETRF
jgi:hypothetical protein